MISKTSYGENSYGSIFWHFSYLVIYCILSDFLYEKTKQKQNNTLKKKIGNFTEIEKYAYAVVSSLYQKKMITKEGMWKEMHYSAYRVLWPDPRLCFLLQEPHGAPAWRDRPPCMTRRVADSAQREPVEKTGTLTTIATITNTPPARKIQGMSLPSSSHLTPRRWEQPPRETASHVFFWPIEAFFVFFIFFTFCYNAKNNFSYSF